LMGFGVQGDPLWRQNVAGVPVFPWWLAIPFYGGILLSFAKLFDTEKRKPAVFALLWLACGVIPSVVTVDAPSTIRMILIVPVLGYFCAEFMHTLGRLSTVYPQLSTHLGRFSWITPLTILILFNSYRSIQLNERWLANEEVAFVWQEAFFEMGRYLDTSASTSTGSVTGSSQGAGVSVLGWSPESLDEASLDLMMARDDLDVRFFGHELAEEVDTVIVPSGGGRILVPRSRQISPLLVERLGEETLFETFAVYEAIDFVKAPVFAVFNNELNLEFFTKACDRECEYVFEFRVWKEVDEPRSFFIHQTGEDGVPVWQDDGLHAPSQFWREGDLILRTVSVPIDASKQLRIGFYNPETGTRLTTNRSLDYFLVEP